jgi:Ca-activated chloride channel family protein
MPDFGSPLVLLLLPVVLVLPWLRRRPRLAFSSLGAVRDGASLRLLLSPLPTALLSLALACLTVALARPWHVDRQRVVEREGIDILLVLDTSGSMEARDYTLNGREASRLAAAKEVIARFVEGRPDDRIGLVVFGEEAFTQVPLTSDQRAMGLFLTQVDIGMAGQRATAVGDAIAVASKHLKDLDAPSKVVILLTDGRSNAGQIEPLTAAEAARSLGIKVYTIGIGGTGGGGRGLLGLLGGGRGSDLDEQTLQAIAKTTEARYFRADDTQTLERVYATIDELEKTTAEVSEFVHREERYAGWLVAGLVLLLVQQLLAQTWLRRLP